jgi:hypothetical protein
VATETPPYLHNLRKAAGTSLLALALLGCGGAGGAPAGYPPAGEMRVVKMEKIKEATDTANLLRNGDFRQWWAGAPVPNAFLPPAEGASKIVLLNEGERYAMVQAWAGPVAEATLDATLRTESTPLETGQAYELQVTAVGAAGRRTTLSLWTKSDTGEWQCTLPNLLTLQPAGTGLKTYRKPFTAKADGPVMISVSGSGTAGEDRMTAWLEWRLTTAQDAAG